jgi:hypothetical protein
MTGAVTCHVELALRFARASLAPGPLDIGHVDTRHHAIPQASEAASPHARARGVWQAHLARRAHLGVPPRQPARAARRGDLLGWRHPAARPGGGARRGRVSRRRRARGGGVVSCAWRRADPRLVRAREGGGAREARRGARRSALAPRRAHPADAHLDHAHRLGSRVRRALAWSESIRNGHRAGREGGSTRAAAAQHRALRRAAPISHRAPSPRGARPARRDVRAAPKTGGDLRAQVRRRGQGRARRRLRAYALQPRSRGPVVQELLGRR